MFFIFYYQQKRIWSCVNNESVCGKETVFRSSEENSIEELKLQQATMIPNDPTVQRKVLIKNLI